jgi:cytochrome P450
MSELTLNPPVFAEPPSADSLPVLGALPHFSRDPLGFLVKTAEEKGPVVRLRLVNRDIYLVSEAGAVYRVLVGNQKNYRKGYEQAKPLMGNGLVTNEGEAWRKQRRLIQPTFSRPQIAYYTNFMLDTAREFSAHWDELAQRGEPFDIAAEMMHLTQTIIVRTMFSSDVGEQSAALGEAFSQTLEYLNRVLFSPSRLLLKLPTPANLRHERALKFLDSFVYGLIEKRRVSGVEQDDLLGRLLAASDPDTGEKMPDQQVRDELMTIFLAGHETTANALAWTWYELGQHADIAARLVGEVDAALQRRDPVMEDLANMPYGAQVFSEALRMYPPAWMFARQSIQEDVLSGYKVPAKAMLFISPYVTQHLHTYWQEPEHFDPERFTDEAVKERPQYAYYPFGGGPRLCIGNYFATVEARLLMAFILRRYTIHLDDSKPVKPTPIATLRPRPGVFVTLEQRS